MHLADFYKIKICCIKKLDLHANLSHLSYYIKKNFRGVGQTKKRTSLNRQLFPNRTKWDVGRSKKAKK